MCIFPLLKLELWCVCAYLYIHTYTDTQELISAAQNNLTKKPKLLYFPEKAYWSSPDDYLTDVQFLIYIFHFACIYLKTSPSEGADSSEKVDIHVQ